MAIKKRTFELLNENPGLTVQAAMDLVEVEMLTHCPLNPPRDGKCAINSLPDKLLVHIFELAWKMELEERIFGEEDIGNMILEPRSLHNEEEHQRPDYDNDNGDNMESDDEDDEYVPMAVDDFDEDDSDEDDSDEDDEADEDGPMAVDDDDEDEDDEDNKDGPMPIDATPVNATPVSLPSATKKVLITPVNVTHVCSRWRRVAIDAPSLWTHISFEKSVALEQHKTFLERAKSSLIDIQLDVNHGMLCSMGGDPFAPVEMEEEGHVHSWQCQRLETEFVRCLLQTVDHNDPTLPTLLGQEDWYTGSYIHELGDPPEECKCCDCQYTFSEFTEILDLLISRLQNLRTLEVMVHDYRWMYLLLARLHQCEPPNNLEELRLLRFGRRNPQYDFAFRPPRLATSFAPFRGIMPNLKRYYLQGVHIDWDACASALGNVKMGRLASHNEEVRPSFPTFVKMVQPLKGRFTLQNSGPRGNGNHWRAIGMTPVVVPWLRRLTVRDLELDYVASLLVFLDITNLKELKLDLLSVFDDISGDELIDALCHTSRVSSKSLLAGLEHLNTTMISRRSQMIRMLEQLENLKTLEARSDTSRVSLLDPLHECKPSTPGQKVYCPLLESLNTDDKTAEQILDIVKARAKAGVPLKRVNLYTGGSLEPDVEKQLNELLEKFEYGFFEVSEAE